MKLSEQITACIAGAKALGLSLEALSHEFAARWGAVGTTPDDKLVIDNFGRYRNHAGKLVHSPRPLLEGYELNEQQIGNIVSNVGCGRDGRFVDSDGKPIGRAFLGFSDGYSEKALPVAWLASTQFILHPDTGRWTNEGPFKDEHTYRTGFSSVTEEDAYDDWGGLNPNANPAGFQH